MFTCLVKCGYTNGYTNLTNRKNYNIVWQLVNTGDVIGSGRTLVMDIAYPTIPLHRDCVERNLYVIATQ